MQLLILGAVFFGIVFLIVAFYGLVNREALEASETAREQLRAGGSYGSVAVNILRDDRSSEIPFLNRLLTGRALTASIATLLERAGSEQIPAHVGCPVGDRLAPWAALGSARLTGRCPGRAVRALPLDEAQGEET
jgi:hypothetical protein